MNRTITIEGELDAARVETLRKTLDELAADNSDLTIEMSRCTFLDSSGVGAVVFIYKRKLARGYKLRLSGLGGQPQKLLRHLGIASLLAENNRSAA
ncbi:MAG: STAS domain-containing protein [Nitratireductor sp.]